MTSTRCFVCGDVTGPSVEPIVIGAVTLTLCIPCGKYTVTAIENQLFRHDACILPCEELTSQQVTSLATYSYNYLLDKLVSCAVIFMIGPLDMDTRRVATALLERLDHFGIARKTHRPDCEIWLEHRICKCPWQLPA